jgi:hypothetical protein
MLDLILTIFISIPTISIPTLPTPTAALKGGLKPESGREGIADRDQIQSSPRDNLIGKFEFEQMIYRVMQIKSILALDHRHSPMETRRIVLEDRPIH